jgi:hypothetical protein
VDGSVLLHGTGGVSRLLASAESGGVFRCPLLEADRCSAEDALDGVCHLRDAAFAHGAPQRHEGVGEGGSQSSSEQLPRAASSLMASKRTGRELTAPIWAAISA